MNLQEKYDWLMHHIGLMEHHPFQNNYYASYAMFGDGLPSEIRADAERQFKSSELYKELMSIAEKRTEVKA